MRIGNSPAFFQSSDINIIICNFIGNSIKSIEIDNKFANIFILGANDSERDIVHSCRRDIHMPDGIFMLRDRWTSMLVFLQIGKFLTFEAITVDLIIDKGSAHIKNY